VTIQLLANTPCGLRRRTSELDWFDWSDFAAAQLLRDILPLRVRLTCLTARQDEAVESAVPILRRSLVEAGGFEPPSVSPLPLDLHV